MLAHSPPLPLTIDHEGNSDHMEVTTADDEEMALALVQRDHVRRIRLWLPAARPPETLQVPHLHHLMLIDFAFPMGSQLLTTALDLVTLCLHIQYPFHSLLFCSCGFAPAGDARDRLFPVMHIMPTPTQITVYLFRVQRLAGQTHRPTPTEDIFIFMTYLRIRCFR